MPRLKTSHFVLLWALVLSFVPARAAESPAQSNATSQLFVSTPVMTLETKSVIELLEQVHYLNKPITDAVFHKLITNYMAELDDNHLFFTTADKDLFLAKYGPVLGKNMREYGSLEAAFHIFTVYHERAKERVAWILDELKKNFDFTTNETYVFDRTEADWPANVTDADKLWHERLKYELIQDLLNDKSIDEAKKNLADRYERLLKNMEEVDAEEVQEIFLTTLTKMYDPHSTFFSAETNEDFNISMRLSLVGIGAILAPEDGYCVVKELVPGAPAALSHQIHPNDKIVAVAQDTGASVDVVGMNLRKVVNLIRGNKGTKVVLTLMPADATDPSTRKKITLVRDVVELSASRAKADIYEVPQKNGGTVPIGVIDIPSFYGPVDDSDTGSGPPVTVSSDVEELVRKLKAANVRGIVLDLRRNGGGLLSEAVNLTGLFIRQGPVVQVRDSVGQIFVKPDTDPKVDYAGPLIVLTSRYSASASEIVAGALQNYGRALIVGDYSTHGKGTVQAVLEMKSFIPRQFFGDEKAGAAKLTVQKFYLPNGFSTQKKGVISDIALPSIEDYLPIGESDLPNALPWDTIRPARFAEHHIDPVMLNELRQKSEDRQNTLEEFKFYKERIAWFRKRQDEKAISLNLDVRRQQKAEDKAFMDEMKAEQTKLAKDNFPVKEVLLDEVQKAKLTQKTVAMNDADKKGTPASTVTPPNTTAPAKAGAGGTDKASPDKAKPDGDKAAPSDDSDEDGAMDDLTGGDPDTPRFDVAMRETLRIFNDALNYSTNANDWIQKDSPLTAQTAAKGSQEPALIP